MKLSKYAAHLGIKYQTAHDHFKKGLIPGAYQLKSGTIIVPDELVDPNMINKAIAEDLEEGDATEEESDEPKAPKKRTQSDMLKAKLTDYKTMLDTGFDATQHIAGAGDLPKPPKKRKDTSGEQEEIRQKAQDIIDTYIHNYITTDELQKISKNNKMREAHIDRLCEIDFPIKTSKDMIIRLKEGIDDDEAIPNIYTTLAQFQTQMMTFMNNRSKHLTEVENYWLDIAEKHGLLTDEENRMEELMNRLAEAEAKAAEAAAGDESGDGDVAEGRVMSLTKLNDMVEQQLLELKQKEEAKAANNPRQSHNPYDNK